MSAQIHSNRESFRICQRVGEVTNNFWGCLGGFSSTAIHPGGGPFSVYLLPQELAKKHLPGTMAVLFGVINFIKLVPYAWLGGFTPTNLMTALVLIPLAPAGVNMGIWLLDRVSQKQGYQLCYLFLFISGLKLFWDGLQSW